MIPSRGNCGLCCFVFLIDDHDSHWDAEPASLMVFGKWFHITGTDTADDNTTVRTYGANYERHNHGLHDTP